MRNTQTNRWTVSLYLRKKSLIFYTSFVVTFAEVHYLSFFGCYYTLSFLPFPCRVGPGSCVCWWRETRLLSCPISYTHLYRRKCDPFFCWWIRGIIVCTPAGDPVRLPVLRTHLEIVRSIVGVWLWVGPLGVLQFCPLNPGRGCLDEDWAAAVVRVAAKCYAVLPLDLGRRCLSVAGRAWLGNQVC